MEKVDSNIKFQADISLVDMPPDILPCENTEEDLFLDSISQNTLGINYYKCDNKHYSIIQTLEHINQVRNTSKIKFDCNGLISRLNLVDFPLSQYTLSFNGINVTTAKACKDYGITIDISQCLKNKKSKLSWFADIIHYVKPDLQNREKFIPLSRIDNIQLCVPNDLKFEYNTVLHIEATGHFPDDDFVNWSDIETRIIDVYPHPLNKFDLNMNHPTDCIDVYIKGNGTLICYISYKEYFKLEINDSNNHYPFHRINLIKNDSHRLNVENSFLSEEINNNTINLTHCHVQLVMLGCEIQKVIQHYYNTFTYPERHALFGSTKVLK